MSSSSLAPPVWDLSALVARSFHIVPRYRVRCQTNPGPEKDTEDALHNVSKHKNIESHYDLAIRGPVSHLAGLTELIDKHL